jgi:hypothetical protein
MAKIEVCSASSRCECISVPKIFDQCRLQVCLTPGILGPAKRDFSSSSCCRTGCTNEKVIPPASAASVTTENFCIKNIAVVNKARSSFRQGCFDVTVKFTFSYCLVFFNNDSDEITKIPACSSYTTTVTLFGGEDLCVAVLNELYGKFMPNGPFASVEASAMPLATELRYPVLGANCGCCCGCCCGPSICDSGTNGCGCSGTSICCSSTNGCGSGTNNCGCGNVSSNCGCGNVSSDCGCGNVSNNCGYNCGNNCGQLSPIAVDVTIGLFAVVKLLRLSNISVHSYGNCTPCECQNVSPDVEDPCDFFESLKFPTGLFAPQTCYQPCSSDGTANVPTGNGKCCDKNC